MSDFMKATLMNKEMLAIHQDSFGISGGLCVSPFSPRSLGRPVLMVAPFFQDRALQNLLFHLWRALILNWAAGSITIPRAMAAPSWRPGRVSRTNQARPQQAACGTARCGRGR